MNDYTSKLGNIGSIRPEKLFYRPDKLRILPEKLCITPKNRAFRFQYYFFVENRKETYRKYP